MLMHLLCVVLCLVDGAGEGNGGTARDGSGGAAAPPATAGAGLEDTFEEVHETIEEPRKGIQEEELRQTIKELRPEGVPVISQLEEANTLLEDRNGILLHNSFDSLSKLTNIAQEYKMGGPTSGFQDLNGWVNLSMSLLPSEPFTRKGTPNTQLYFSARKCQIHMSSPVDIDSDRAIPIDVVQWVNNQNMFTLQDGTNLKGKGYHITQSLLRYSKDYCERMFFLARVTRELAKSETDPWGEPWSQSDKHGRVEVSHETLRGIQECQETKIFQTFGAALEYPHHFLTGEKGKVPVDKGPERDPNNLPHGSPREVDTGKGAFWKRPVDSEVSPMLDNIRTAINTGFFHMHHQGSEFGEAQLTTRFGTHTEVIADCPVSALVGINPISHGPKEITDDSINFLFNNLIRPGKRGGSKLLDPTFWMKYVPKKGENSEQELGKFQHVETEGKAIDEDNQVKIGSSDMARIQKLVESANENMEQGKDFEKEKESKGKGAKGKLLLQAKAEKDKQDNDEDTELAWRLLDYLRI